MEHSGSGPVRPSPIAGTWYPREPNALTRAVREMLRQAEPSPVDKELIGLVSPHAGLIYSGPVAAAGYRLLEKRHFDTAVLLGPSHFMQFSGASVYPRGCFETPLGQAAVDEELASATTSPSS